MTSLIRRTALTLAAACMLAGTPAAHAQAELNDPALQQSVAADERIAPRGEQTVISAGHADLGPIFVDGELQFMVRDDSQVPPVWRHLDDVVLDISDKAIQTLPEGGDFDFTGATPGQQVWVIPQSEVAGVPWLGWNTQSPEVVERTDRGVNLEFGGHEGPGDFTVFLQAGGFSQPQQLWNSRLVGNQPMWVELNTHTHANWVFTQPGVHLVGIRAVVKGTDGQTRTTEQVLRLAVGDATNHEQARAASFEGPWRTDATSGAEPETPQEGPGALWAVLGIGVAALLICALSLVFFNRSRARRDAAVESVQRGES